MSTNTTKRRGVYPLYDYTATVKQLNGGGDVEYKDNSLIRISKKLNLSPTAVLNIINRKSSRFKNVQIDRILTQYGIKHANKFIDRR